MTTRLNPYLGFRDQAGPAMEYYRSLFGGTLTVRTFGESGFGDPDDADKVMHSTLQTDDGLTLMAADTPTGMDYDDGTAMSISLSGDDETTLNRYWDGLTDGGTVIEPLTQAPWGERYGMCVDRFGVSWMVNTATSA